MEKFAHLYSSERLQRIFGTKETKKVIPVTVSFTYNNYMPSGSPGLILAPEIDKLENDDFSYKSLFSRRKNKTVFFPFPTKVGNPPGFYTEIYHENIYPLPQKNLITNHKIKIIGGFKKNKLYDIHNYITTNGAITFLIPDLLNAYSFWGNIRNLCTKYKYTVLFNHLRGSQLKQSSTSKFIPFVSFIDLPYCIPIFDHRKIDGMGICCGFMYDCGEGKGSITIDTLCFVLSNYYTNVFYLDGVTIRTPTKIDNAIIGYMLRIINDEINPIPKIKQSPQKTENKGILMPRNEKITVSVDTFLNSKQYIWDVLSNSTHFSGTSTDNHMLGGRIN